MDMTAKLLCNLTLTPPPYTFLSVRDPVNVSNLKVFCHSPLAHPPLEVHIPSLFLSIFRVTLIFLALYLTIPSCLSLPFFPTASHTFSKPGAVWAAPTKPPLCHWQPLFPCPHQPTVGVPERESERRSHLSPACPPHLTSRSPCLSGTKAVPLNSAQ